MDVKTIIAQLFEHDILITPEQAGKLTEQDALVLQKLLKRPREAEAYLQALATLTRATPPLTRPVPSETDHAHPGTTQAGVVSLSKPATGGRVQAIGDMIPVSVVRHYAKKPRKRSYNDFVQYFNTRMRAMERMLRARTELAAASSIDRVRHHRDQGSARQQVALIGLVLDKRDTKNEHIILELEDRTGTISVLCSKNKPELLELAKELSYDEIIGVTGVLGDGIVFADQILLPGVPPGNELKKAPEEVYAVAISDTEFGSKDFYHKEFDTFLAWLSGEAGTDEARAVARKVKYVFIGGDVVAGVGVFPSQENNLSLTSIYDQYRVADEVLDRIPADKHIMIIPGNHDIGRLSEPQQALPRELMPRLASRENVHFLSNPSWVRIHQSKNFPGFLVLLYHGGSFIYYGNTVMRLFQEGGMSNPCAVMQYLLQRRHLSPSHTATLYVPDSEEDPLILHDLPDIIVTGHLHTTQEKTWNGITMLSCSCWVPINDYQIKQGLKIDPGKFMLINLQTRKVQALRPEDLV